jgi:hypothetical protein
MDKLMSWGEGLIVHILLMVPLFCIKRLSNRKLILLAISSLHTQCFGEGSFYYCFGIHRLHLIKNLTLLRVSPVRKSIAIFEVTLKAHLYSTIPPLLHMLKCKNCEG